MVIDVVACSLCFDVVPRLGARPDAVSLLAPRKEMPWREGLRYVRPHEGHTVLTMQKVGWQQATKALQALSALDFRDLPPKTLGYTILIYIIILILIIITMIRIIVNI